MYKAKIRVRMMASDAHYAGELVNGAHMLSIFGDLATELAICSDGDEGLFRTYEHVDFLAPVYAGDFIEAVGWYSSYGVTSRTMEFEAWKVIGLTRADKAHSAADILQKPVLVGRATGIIVIPKNCQRKGFMSLEDMIKPD